MGEAYSATWAQQTTSVYFSLSLFTNTRCVRARTILYDNGRRVYPGSCGSGGGSSGGSEIKNFNSANNKIRVINCSRINVSGIVFEKHTRTSRRRATWYSAYHGCWERTADRAPLWQRQNNHREEGRCAAAAAGPTKARTRRRKCEERRAV